MAKEAAQPQDQSMEEILQSIKRIIAEENQEDTEMADTKKTKAPVEVTASDKDVLDLTEVADEEEYSEKEPDAAPPVMEAAPPIAAEPPPPSPQPVISPVSANSTRTESILEAVDRSPPREAPTDVLDDIDSLLSSEAAKASAKALKSLQSPPKPVKQSSQAVSPGMPFRSGTTVEDLAMEALRPMLKDWLDANLPGIVERLVEREVKKLSNQ